MHRWCICAITVSLLTCSGCHGFLPGRADRWRSSPPETRTAPPLRPSVPAVTEVREAGAVPAPAPEGEITLRRAMALALEHSPRLAAFAWDVRQAEARILQAGLWSNPEFEAEVENIAGSGPLSGIDSAEATVSLAQTFPLGGDIRRRRELARLGVELASWDYEAARLEVLEEVTRRLVEALAADRRLELARQELELARTTRDVTIRRVEAGDASPVEKARVEVPVVTVEVDVRRAERVRRAAYSRLALTWNARQVTFDRVVGDLDRLEPVPAPEAMAGEIGRNPAVARWATEISERIAQRRLAEAEAVPDLTARVGFKHHNDSDERAFVVGVSLPLPLFNHRQGDILAARRGEQAARRRQRDAELRIEAMLNSAYADLAAAHDEATALGQRAVPAAEEAFAATRRAFEEDKLSFTDVLDAQRTLFDIQRRRLDSLVAYHTAASELESLIGRQLGDLSNPSQEQGE